MGVIQFAQVPRRNQKKVTPVITLPSTFSTSLARTENEIRLMTIAMLPACKGRVESRVAGCRSDVSSANHQGCEPPSLTEEEPTRVRFHPENALHLAQLLPARTALHKHALHTSSHKPKPTGDPRWPRPQTKSRKIGSCLLPALTRNPPPLAC